ncbi:hypothetical protein Tco_0776668 [Tanacetum coccineum]
MALKLQRGYFLSIYGRPSSGVKLLGGAISRDADFISGLPIRRAANAVDLMGLHPQFDGYAQFVARMFGFPLGNMRCIVKSSHDSHNIDKNRLEDVWDSPPAKKKHS